MDALTLRREPRGAWLRRNAARLGLLLVCWSALTGGVFSGCRGLFTPAVPEPPTSKPIIPNYRSPELTLKTMKDALAAKAQGSSAWLGAFADSTGPGIPGYHQFFDPADVTVFESSGLRAPSDWGLAQEQTFYLQFLSVRPSDTYTLTFDLNLDLPDPEPTADEAILHRRYRVIATSPDGGSSLVIAVGYVDLTFARNSSDFWLIRRWDDHVDPTVGANPVDPYQLTLGRRRLESAQ